MDKFRHENYLDRFRHQKTDSGLGLGLGIKSIWFVKVQEKYLVRPMTSSFPPVKITTTTRCHRLSINVNNRTFYFFVPGIPCPIIVAWAIGKLYYENEQ